ncbi:MAG: hypothetical protein IPJ99_00400 [Betaproteobacteria bacterium]|nr:hypothetical protein [Betaproteobacteria bacterium]
MTTCKGRKLSSFPDEALDGRVSLKQPKTFAALALLFHLIDCADAIRQGHAPGPVVSESAARRAAGWRTYLEAHARRIFALGQTPAKPGWPANWPAASKPARLDGADSFTARDIYRKQWHLDERRVAPSAKPSRQLVDAGWLTARCAGGRWQQRGCVRYRVNAKRADQSRLTMPRAWAAVQFHGARV